jgi:hypothetical protein
MDKSNNNGKPSKAPTRLVDPFGLDLSRWTEGFAARRCNDRWSRWAGLLASRHRAISRVGARASMIFAASGVVARILRERCIGAINLYPTVKLSVRQILGQIPSRSGETLMPLSHEPFHLARAARSADRTYPATSAANSLEARRSAGPSELGYRPLDRVFLRLNGADDFSPGRARTALLQDALDATRRRVIKNTQRLEDRTARSGSGASAFVFRQTTPTNMPVNTSDWADDRQDTRGRERALPSVDVDALTDHVIRQIDQRATAWRERMGKI